MEGSANPVGGVVLVRVVALDLQKQTIHTSGCGQLEWVWFNLSGCCYLQVYLIVSKVGGEEGGVSVQDVFQQLCEERERESATV